MIVEGYALFGKVKGERTRLSRVFKTKKQAENLKKKLEKINKETIFPEFMKLPKLTIKPYPYLKFLDKKKRRS